MCSPLKDTCPHSVPSQPLACLGMHQFHSKEKEHCEFREAVPNLASAKEPAQERRTMPGGLVLCCPSNIALLHTICNAIRTSRARLRASPIEGHAAKSCANLLVPGSMLFGWLCLCLCLYLCVCQNKGPVLRRDFVGPMKLQVFQEVLG